MPSDSFIMPSGVRSGELQHHLLVADRDVIDAEPAALDLAPCFAVRCHEACPDKPGQYADAGLKFAAGNLDGRQIGVDRAFLKGLARGFGGRARGIRAVQQRGRGIGQCLLGLVDFSTLQCCELLDLG